MKTAPRVSFGLYNLEIKMDSSPAMPNLQAFSNAVDLRRNNVSPNPPASYEPDFWLLDGGYKFLPTSYTGLHVGIISQAMSNGSGVFSSAPVLTVTFSETHDTDGLTVHFSPYTGDFASSFKAAYYNASNALIREDTYTPTGAVFSVNQAVTGFKKLVLTFYGTNRPYRYLRVTAVDYGELLNFTAEDIISATVVEDIDPLSGQARYNTFDLTLFSSDAAFSIINPDAYSNYLQQRQPVSVYELINNAPLFIGQFYLNKWENKSDQKIEFRCVDLLGILDTITYRGGMFSAVSLPVLLAAILDPISISFDLDAALNGVAVTGWIPICSYRQALQQIALAVGAYLDCSRSHSIKINQTPIAASAAGYSAVILHADQSVDQSLSLKAQVTGVQVTAHNYVSVVTSRQVYNGILTVGQHEITFSEPLHDLSVTGATITESGANYAILNVAAQGTVTLSGQTYLDTTRIMSVNASVGVTVKPNVVKVTNATLINPSNLSAVAQRVFDYYQQRFLQKVKLIAPTIKPGDVVVIDTLYNEQLRCVVEKMTLDLTGGFVCQVEMTGVEHG